jgi:hypothetical protein
MTNERVLHERVREALQAGELPRQRPDNTWAGPGVGADCTICRAPVTPTEMEYELEFVRGGDEPGRDRYHVHIHCFLAWSAESQGVRAEQPPGTKGEPRVDPQ